MPATARDATAELWLATLQRAIGRASHDVKDSLNGVSVNLEVIRSRAGRAGTPASDVGAFAEAAGQQLGRLTTLIEAVLAVGKQEREPVDVATTLRRVTALCGASASSADAAVELRVGDVEPFGSTTTPVRGDAVRLAIAAPLLDAITGASHATQASTVTCTLGADEQSILVSIGAAGRRTLMPGTVATVVRAAGIRWTEGPQDLSLAFPRL